jgi:SAM-dependent methyltransferase
MPITLTTLDYVRDCFWNYSLPYWLVGGPDYSRAVEYPLVSRLLRAGPGEQLLDVGVGRRAEFARLMAERGMNVLAIDAREDVGADVGTRRGLLVRRADARQLEFADNSFDRVSAISTIEHIEDGDNAAMAELARVLRPGGRLVVTVPFNPLKRATIFARDHVYGRTGEQVFFEYIYDEDSLQERIVRPTGLRVVERIHLGEPGFRVSGIFYAQRGLAGKARRALPIGWALGLLAPLCLRPMAREKIHFEDWTGVAVVLAFEK